MAESAQDERQRYEENVRRFLCTDNADTFCCENCDLADRAALYFEQLYGGDLRREIAFPEHLYNFHPKGTHWLQTMPNTAHRLLSLIHSICGDFGEPDDPLDVRTAKWFYAQQTGQECTNVEDLARLVDPGAAGRQVPVFRSSLHFLDVNSFRLEPHELAGRVQRLTGHGMWPLF